MNDTNELSVVYQMTEILKPCEKNPRTHTKTQIRQIADSIVAFGFTNPVLVDSYGKIVAGHGRVEAAKLLGMDNVPTIFLENLTEEQIRAYVVADNRLAELAGWDKEILRLEFEALGELELGFDLSVIGFDAVEITALLDGGDVKATDSEHDYVPEIDPMAKGVSRLGDLWSCGRHRLLGGNALDHAAYGRLLDGKKAQMILTDPPYNVPIDGHVGGKGSVKHREFVMAYGEMSEAEFDAFLRTAIGHLVTFSTDGSIHYVFIDWRHAHVVSAVGRDMYTEHKNICVWNKSNAGMGSFYRSRHEFVFVFKNGPGKHINNFALGQYGRNRTNVWDYAGVNALGPGRLEELSLHPTVKPVALIADAIKDCSRRGSIILDPFCGSGTLLSPPKSRAAADTEWNWIPCTWMWLYAAGRR